MASKFQPNIREVQETSQGSGVSPLGTALAGVGKVGEAVTQAKVMLEDRSDLQDFREGLASEATLEAAVDKEDFEASENRLKNLYLSVQQKKKTKTAAQARVNSELQALAVKNPRVYDKAVTYARSLGLLGSGSSVAGTDALNAAQKSMIEEVDKHQLANPGSTLDQSIAFVQDKVQRLENETITDYNHKLWKQNNEVVDRDNAVVAREYADGVEKTMLNNSYNSLYGDEGILTTFQTTANQLANDPAALQDFQANTLVNVEAATRKGLLQLDTAFANAPVPVSTEEQNRIKKGFTDQMKAVADLLGGSEGQLDIMQRAKTLNDYTSERGSLNAQKKLRELGTQEGGLIAQIVSDDGVAGALGILIDVQKAYSTQNMQALRLQAEGTSPEAAQARQALALMEAGVDNNDINSLFAAIMDGANWTITGNAAIDGEIFTSLWNKGMRDARPSKEVNKTLKDKTGDTGEGVGTKEDYDFSQIVTAQENSLLTKNIVSPETLVALSTNPDKQAAYDKASINASPNMVAELLDTTVAGEVTLDDSKAMSIEISIPSDSSKFVLTSTPMQPRGGRGRGVSITGKRYNMAAPIFKRTVVGTERVTQTRRGQTTTTNVDYKDVDGFNRINTIIAGMAQYKSPEEVRTWIETNIVPDLLAAGVSVTINDELLNPTEKGGEE